MVRHEDVRVHRATHERRELFEKPEVETEIGLACKASGPVHAALDEVQGMTDAADSTLPSHGASNARPGAGDDFDRYGAGVASGLSLSTT